MQANTRHLRATIVILGTFILMGFYYWVHKPITLTLIVALGRVLLSLLAASLTLTLSGTLGHFVIPKRLLTSLGSGERLGITFCVGVGTSSWLSLLIASVGLFQPIILWGVSITLLVILNQSTRRWLRDLQQAVYALPSTKRTWHLALAIGIGLSLISSLILSVLPPTAPDSITYHLVAVQRLLTSGRMQGYSDNMYLGLPQTGEMLFAWGIGLVGQDTAAAPIHWGMGVIGLLTLAGLVRHYTEDAEVTWIALGLTVLAYGIWSLLAQPYVDMLVFAFSVATFVILSKWQDTRHVTWLILIGLLAGMAIGIKYTAGMILIGAGVFIMVHQPRHMIRNGLLIGVITILAYMPWGIRGAIHYGNPVYPVLFGGFNLTSSHTSEFLGHGTSLSGLLDKGLWYEIPFILIFATVLGVHGARTYGFEVGAWLFLMWGLIPIGWHTLTQTERQLIRCATWYVIPMVLVWMINSSLSEFGGQTRLAMSVFPPFAVLAGLGLATLRRWGRYPFDVYLFVRAAIAFTLVLNAFPMTKYFVVSKPMHFILGLVSSDEYLATYQDNPIVRSYYNAMQALAAHLPPESHVLFLWESSTYYCPDRIICDPDIFGGHWIQPLKEGSTTSNIIADWRAQDVYLLVAVSRFQLEYYQRQPEVRSFNQTLQNEAVQLWADDTGDFVLYRLR